MHALTTRVTPLLMAVLMFPATGLPVAADPEDNGDGWGRQAGEWCRDDDHIEEFKNFGQCVSDRVHELKGDSAEKNDEQDDQDDEDSVEAKQNGQGKGLGHTKNKTKDEQDTDVESEQDDNASHGHGPKKVGQQRGQGQGVGKNKNK